LNNVDANATANTRVGPTNDRDGRRVTVCEVGGPFIIDSSPLEKNVHVARSPAGLDIDSEIERVDDDPAI
jgi:hypothetical protein